MAWAPEEFQRVFRARYPELVQFAHAFTGSREAGEDLAQEAFVRLWSRGPVTRPKADYWLFRVVRNLALDWLKTERRRRNREQQAHQEVDPPPFTDDDVRRIRESVSELPQRSREVLLLREFGNLSYNEIAKMVGRSENVVKQDLYRARERLRRMWTEKFGPEE
ncbi:MAG: sigma-70 family RNA polymerase sigma factor [Gemmatimonadales bacterium]|nr:sigma-70 family RNA polymerase sigma factor [Gemmatimonadales bacterium]